VTPEEEAAIIRQVTRNVNKWIKKIAEIPLFFIILENKSLLYRKCYSGLVKKMNMG